MIEDSPDGRYMYLIQRSVPNLIGINAGFSGNYLKKQDIQYRAHLSLMSLSLCVCVELLNPHV